MVTRFYLYILAIRGNILFRVNYQPMARLIGFKL